MLEAGLEPIPGYLLTRCLGEGAFSSVWEARGKQGDVLAFKFLKRHARDAESLAGEATILKALRDLRHPGVIAFYGSFSFAHYLVLSLERADGNLAELCDTYRQDFGTSMPRGDALHLLGQVAETLDFLGSKRLPGFNAFSCGMQHCDIKPANLLMVGDQLKVADFGLAAATTVRRRRDLGCRGSLPYAPPELFRGQPAPTSDQYALAVTWCEVCVGSHILTPVARIEASPGILPVDLTKLSEKEAPIIQRALHAEPAKRWSDCRAFLAELQATQRNPFDLVLAETNLIR